MARLEDLMNDPEKARAIEGYFQHQTDQQQFQLKQAQEAQKKLEQAKANQAKAPSYNKNAFNSDIDKFQKQIDDANNKASTYQRNIDSMQAALSNNNVDIVTNKNAGTTSDKYSILNKETGYNTTLDINKPEHTTGDKLQISTVKTAPINKETSTINANLSKEQQEMLAYNKKQAEKVSQKQKTAATKAQEQKQKSPVSEKEQQKEDKEKEKTKKANTPTDKEKETFEQEKAKNIDTSDLPIPPKVTQGPAHTIDITIIFADKQGSNWNITAYLKYVTVWKLFEDKFKPIYKIGFELPISLVKKIEKAKNYKYRLTIKTNNYEMLNRDLNMLPLGTEGNKMSKVLDLYLVPFQLPPNRCGAEVDKLLKKQDPKAKEQRLEYEVECFDINHVKSANVMVSCNYRSQPIKSIIIDLLNRYKNECLPNIKNLVLTEPDNTSTLYSITLEPGCLHDSISRLHECFHIYKKDIMLFLNDDTFYFIKRGSTPSYKNGKLDRVTIIIGGRDQINSNEGAAIYKLIKESNEQEVVYFSDIDPVLEDNSAAILSQFGDKIVMKSDTSPCGLNSNCMGMKDDADPLKSIKYADGNSLVNDAYEGKENFIVYDNDAPYNMELLIDQAQREAYHASLILSDVNFSHFTPSTGVQLYFCDSEKKSFDGQWWIKSVVGLYSVGSSSTGVNLRVRLDLARKFGDDGKVIK